MSEEQRYQAQLEKQRLSEDLLQTRNQRAAVVRQLEDGITPTSTGGAGRVGVQLDISPENLAALNDETRRLRAGALRGYDTPRTRTTALKSGLLPGLAVLLQIGNIGEAWKTWRRHMSNSSTSATQDLILIGAFLGIASAALAVYQSMHVAMVDNALQTVLHKSAGMAGTQLAAKAGKLGLGLGWLISPMAFAGSVGTTLDNWNKWRDAFLIGTPGEKAGALTALVGDFGATGVSGTVASRAFYEGWGLRQDYLKSLPHEKQITLAKAWATRGPRFMLFSTRITPIGMIFTALQLGGEALYNYNNIDDQQRWLLRCCWGVSPKGWDWIAHSQKLAEATFLPQIYDKGIHRSINQDEPIRRLHLSLPGLSLANFNDTSLRWSALLQKSPDDWDAGEALASSLKFVSDRPLTLELNIPDQWQGVQAQLQLRLAVRPSLATHYLKFDKGHLHYRIPLSPDIVSKKPITASAVVPPSSQSLKETKITRTLLNELK